jgi:hypothetical protein
MGWLAPRPTRSRRPRWRWRSSALTASGSIPMEVARGAHGASARGLPSGGAETALWPRRRLDVDLIDRLHAQCSPGEQHGRGRRRRGMVCRGREPGARGRLQVAGALAQALLVKKRCLRFI